MFRRRQTLPRWQRLSRWVWPHIGWRRAGAYLWARLKRLPGTPHSIAAGFACGVAISFTPFVGLHLIGSFALALPLRGNFIAAWVGTLVGNPWTFPFMWWLSFHTGLFILGADPAPFISFDNLTWSWDAVVDRLGRVFWPTAAGGVPVGICAGLVSYALMVRLVATYQEARRRRREVVRKKRHDLKQLTGTSTGAA